MTNIEISSIIASCTSVILAIVAIALSILFFRMSSLLSESTKEASKSISAGVERLEKLFDKLYADTFSMMKEAYSDMRKHIWPEESTNTDKITEEVEKKADEKVNLLKVEINKELSKMFQTQKITSAKLSSMRHLIDKAVSSSRRVEIEAREETVRNQIRHLIRMMQRERKKVVADEIVDRLANKLNPSKVISEMEKMVDEGELSLNTDSLGPETIIKLLR
ncbi:unnamed protein product [marine sediment metagenome]|uniref:Uncharacterized protein n=1 Tax=marine sediment metagenome TaxID=412755 RepID=X1A2J8_9ZZZZ